MGCDLGGKGVWGVTVGREGIWGVTVWVGRGMRV